MPKLEVIKVFFLMTLDPQSAPEPEISSSNSKCTKSEEIIQVFNKYLK